MNLQIESVPLASAALAVGVVSAALYGRKRKWIDALLVTAAGAALAVALADVRLPASAASAVSVASDAAGGVSERDLLAIPKASAIALSGDGVREAEWRDLPARPLQWQPAAADVLQLDFPRSMALGRMFTLTVRRSQPQAGWRLQLLAENKQVLADSNASGAAAATPAAVSGAADAAPAASKVSTTAPSQLTVQWLPPVAEAMVLQARVLDAAGKVVAEGPVPLQVKDALPLQIQGRFDAPSFDARALNQLLADGGALLDWQVTLGKAISRSETARTPLTTPNALFVDAAYIEHLNPSARAALLAQAGQGMPLVIMGGNAADAALWQRELGLRLHQQSATTEKEDARQFNAGGLALTLPPAPLNPGDANAEPWQVSARDGKRQPWLWQREWQRGRIVWIGVSDWHRYAISAPQALAMWWQDAMDRIAQASERKTAWQAADAMPLPGLRTELCAQGVKAGTALHVGGAPELAPQDLVLQTRVDKADAVCAALWPQKSGWLTFTAAGMAEPGRVYVYAKSDWPLWQKALRREATAQYAARYISNGATVAGEGRALPAMPFAVLFALCLLGLWWRDQRSQGANEEAASQP